MGDAVGSWVTPAAPSAGGVRRQSRPGAGQSRAATGEGREVGITSYGFGCAPAGFPGVYGEVQAFSNAIKSRISSTGTIVR